MQTNVVTPTKMEHFLTCLDAFSKAIVDTLERTPDYHAGGRCVIDFEACRPGECPVHFLECLTKAQWEIEQIRSRNES